MPYSLSKMLYGVVLLLLSAMSVQGFTLAHTRPRTQALRASVDNTDGPLSREACLRQTAAAGIAWAALAKQTFAQEYVDDKNGIQFQVPDGWEKSQAEISGRRQIVVYTSPDKAGANIFVAYSPVQGDFTSLGSFGTVDDVSNTVLPQGAGVSSRLLESAARRNTYYYDYVVAQDGRPEKRIKTLWYMEPGTQLITLTAQCNEADSSSLASSLDKTISSFSVRSAKK